MKYTPELKYSQLQKYAEPPVDSSDVFYHFEGKGKLIPRTLIYEEENINDNNNISDDVLELISSEDNELEEEEEEEEDYDDDDELVLGWKIHISIQDIDKVSKAYDIIAPVIAEYCYFFKVFNSEEEKKLVNKQFTLYLTLKNQEFISSEKVKIMINRIESLLKENGIKPSEPPPSDIKFKNSAYCSLRNDQWGVGQLKQYISEKQVEKTFNPSNHYNPYRDLVDSPVLSFDHYLCPFPINNEKLNPAPRFLNFLVSYLNEYINVEELLKEKIPDRCSDKKYCQAMSLLFANISCATIKPEWVRSAFAERNIEPVFTYLSYITYVCSMECDGFCYNIHSGLRELKLRPGLLEGEFAKQLDLIFPHLCFPINKMQFWPQTHTRLENLLKEWDNFRHGSKALNTLVNLHSHF